MTSGLTRTGTSGSRFSGDLFLALSTANPDAFTPGDSRARVSPTDTPRYDQFTFIPWSYLDPFYEAIVQATMETVINSLTANEEMTGRDGRSTPRRSRANG